jgi:hypothetical protein
MSAKRGLETVAAKGKIPAAARNLISGVKFEEYYFTDRAILGFLCSY